MGEAGRARTVLVVEPDEDVRDLIGDWLEDDGFDVIGCPGPRAPTYDCVGSRSGVCPLEAEADIVLLDLCQASDLAMEGTPAEELLAFYTWKGRPVVAMRHGGGSVQAADPELVTVIGSPPVRDAVLDAVRGLVERGDATAGS